MLLFTILSTALAGNPGIVKLDHVQYFQLKEPSEYAWNAEHPRFDKGTIVVVEVDPGKARVRQVGGPVLYVGSTPAARANPGRINGHIVAFVPGHVDLKKVPVYWGPPDLPESVTSNDGADTLARSGSIPFDVKEVQPVSSQPVNLDSYDHLYSHIADLIDRHAPDDGDFARGYRLAHGQ